jgi:hypothetical protein
MDALIQASKRRVLTAREQATLQSLLDAGQDATIAMLDQRAKLETGKRRLVVGTRNRSKRAA